MSQEQSNQPQSGQQIQVKVPDEILKGAYSNMVQVGHSKEEFVLDFMNLFPPTGIVLARIFLSPAHMKRIVAALQDNLKRYEEQFGTIEAGSAPDHKIGFRTE